MSKLVVDANRRAIVGPARRRVDARVGGVLTAQELRTYNQHQEEQGGARQRVGTSSNLLFKGGHSHGRFFLLVGKVYRVKNANARLRKSTNFEVTHFSGRVRTGSKGLGR